MQLRMTYLLTRLIISRGYLSSILRSISLFHNLRLSRIFCYLSTFGICQFTNVIFREKSITCGLEKVAYLTEKTPYTNAHANILRFEFLI